MGNSAILPDDFGDYLTIENAPQRFQEASEVAQKSPQQGFNCIPIWITPQSFVIHRILLQDRLKQLGYISGWDARCYPSPVDECDYINVSARLPEDSLERGNGWFDYVAVVHPVDDQALNHMLSQGYGNPFIHHLTWGIVPPDHAGVSDFDYAGIVVRFMVGTRTVIADAIGDEPGTLIIALPQEVMDHPDFVDALPTWVDGLAADQYQVESMQGGGFLIQFFVLTGGRIEVALRSGTTQTFNPKSVDKISKDEISAIQDDES